MIISIALMLSACGNTKPAPTAVPTEVPATEAPKAEEPAEVTISEEPTDTVASEEPEAEEPAAEVLQYIGLPEGNRPLP